MSDTGYSPKELTFSDEGRSKLISGISKLSAAVKSTLGPRGNTVLIESPYHTNGVTITKDGVTVAKSIDLIDPVENLAVRMMKQAADRTASSAGDGTTSAIVLTEALVTAGTELITKHMNRTMVLRNMQSISEEVVAMLKMDARKVYQKDLRNVASISANNDAYVGRIIAETYKSIGKDGIVTVEKAQGSETYAETTMGLKIARGYTSHLFINDFKRDECVMDDASVLVCDTEIVNVLQIESLLRPFIGSGKRLLIISPVSVNTLNTLAANVMRNGLKLCVIAPPSFGYKQHELMQDIALALGATYFSDKTGNDLSVIKMEDLGHASKVVVGAQSTVVIRGKKGEQELIDERVSQLASSVTASTKKSDRDFIMERIASLKGGIGVIHVGGNTDIEQKELYDRIDDAVCAVRSALEEGIVSGGGKALYDIANKIFDKYVAGKDTDEMSIAAQIMFDAMRAPLFTIMENAWCGEEAVRESAIDGKLDIEGYGMDVKAMEWCYLEQRGIVDPVKVTRSALENAVSVAVTILSTDAIVTMARSYEAKQ